MATIEDAVQEQTANYAAAIAKAVNGNTAGDISALKGYYADESEIVSPYRGHIASSTSNQFVNQWIDEYVAEG